MTLNQLALICMARTGRAFVFFSLGHDPVTIVSGSRLSFLYLFSFFLCISFFLLVHVTCSILRLLVFLDSSVFFVVFKSARPSSSPSLQPRINCDSINVDSVNAYLPSVSASNSQHHDSLAIFTSTPALTGSRADDAMAKAIEAKSLSYINDRANQPSQYFESAAEAQKQDPLVLYISRVVGLNGSLFIVQRRHPCFIADIQAQLSFSPPLFQTRGSSRPRMSKALCIWCIWTILTLRQFEVKPNADLARTPAGSPSRSFHDDLLVARTVH